MEFGRNGRGRTLTAGAEGEVLLGLGDKVSSVAAALFLAFDVSRLSASILEVVCEA